MSFAIRPYRGTWWRPNQDHAIEIEGAPHPFQEQADRWTEKGTEHPMYGGCLWCGASELSTIHLQHLPVDPSR